MSRNRYEEMTDYEKAVARLAGELYIVNMAAACAADPEGEGVECSEMVSEAIVEAFEIIDGVLEVTRR